MLFTQIEFFFFAIFVFIALLIVRGNDGRKRILLGASYYFYAYWDWRFLGLILLSTFIDFYVAKWMVLTSSNRRRKLLLLVSLCANLGLLGFFKYFNFFVDSAAVCLQALGFRESGTSTLSIILPVGISFYTFQTLSYTIDVYRGRIPVCSRLSDFALYVAFFPQLVAGPIVRASEFLPQLVRGPRLSWARSFSGAKLFTLGLFKKLFIADHLGAFVDPVFQDAGVYDGTTTQLAVIAFAVQIYCDFSGYTDMAIGIARALGYKFNRNFNRPYLATSITAFWQRWHISLSTWLRDYLYIPLGGNRHGQFITYRNLLATMVLGGLWHGASWTFVVWGILHGGLMSVERAIGSQELRQAERAPVADKLILTHPFRWAITMFFVLVAWILFRAETFGQAMLMLEGFVWIGPGTLHWIPTSVCLRCLLVIAAEAAPLCGIEAFDKRTFSWRTVAIIAGMIYLVLLYPPRAFAPFVYFQF